MKTLLQIFVFNLTVLLFACNSTRSSTVSFSDNSNNHYLKYRVLNLTGKELDSLPDSIFRFKLLEELYLGANDFVFYGPASLPSKKNHLSNLSYKICQLKKIRKIDLTFNNFENIPSALSLLDSLTDLNLAYNEKLSLVENVDKVKQLKNLKTLVLIGTNTTSEEAEKVMRTLNGKVSIIYGRQAYIDYLNGN